MAGCWRRPEIHFAAIGALLFALDSGLERAPGPNRTPATGARLRSEPIAISSQQIATLRRDWLARSGRFPTAGELEALIEVRIDEEVLLREAREQGLHRTDFLVGRRLVRNLRFIGDDPTRSDADLWSEALALGMDRTDLVVRRRLIQRMQLAVRGALPEPTQAALEAFRAAHVDRFTEPAGIRLSHVYLSRDRRGEEVAFDARRLLTRLREESIDPAQARSLGDSFLFQHDLPVRSPAELGRLFGVPFAREVARVEPERWAGPIASSYGQHLVWVHERSPERAAELASVRGEVREALLTERADAQLAKRLRWWRAQVSIRVEDFAS
ncbi:MAG: peptidylprolyl isomerase [Proteobacteria bacterium]|nr:peptidylprolyl isomerase [Pseudomonadota bacterium]